MSLRRFVRILAGVLSAALSAMFFDGFLARIWAASFHDQYQDLYMRHASLFLGCALFFVLVLGFVILVWPRIWPLSK